LNEFLENVQLAFLSGNSDGLEKYFRWPLVVYSVAGVSVIRNQVDFRRVATQYRAALTALSVETSDTTIQTREPRTNNRLCATVRVRDYDAQGVKVVCSLVRYFLVQEPDGYKIEMLEYVESPLTAQEIERIVH